MNSFRRIERRLRRILFRQRTEADMAEEMRFHLEQRAAGYARAGMSDCEARQSAQRRFGNLGSIRERAWDAHGWRGLEFLLKDLRLASRQLVRSRGFAVVAILTLGLGIGANTSAFNILKTVFLRPLPYMDTARLDRIYRATAQNAEGGFSPADFLALRRATGGYEEIAAYSATDASLSEPGHPAEMARAVRVTVNLFGLLGVQPQLGRDFHVDEESPGNDRIVILSQRTWRKRFEGKPDVIGRSIRIDGEPHRIIGVLPETFNDWRHLGWVDLFRPLALDESKAADRSAASLRLIGRRSSARTRAETDDYLAAFGAQLATEFPEANAGSSWRTLPLYDTIAGRRRGVVFAMLIGLSGFVLLISCSNLANLFLARTMARAREFAVRGALGASRTQLLRPLIAESLVLALGGGGCALFVALWVGHWLCGRSTMANGEVIPFVLDWPVFGWALAASLLTALAFVVAPALFAMRLNLNDTLRSGVRGMMGGRGHQRFRQILIVGQFAFAMVLLAAAGLFIRGIDDLNDRRAGWESASLVTATYLLPATSYTNADEVTAFHRQTVERLEALPGVTSVSISSFSPFFAWADSRKLVVEDRERPEPGREPAAFVNAVTPAYFTTFHTNVLAGRTFTEHDSPDGPRVFVVNETMARNLFGGESPLGRRLAQAGAEDLNWGEIVGVVADVHPVLPDPRPVAFQLYVPMAQEPRLHAELAVRGSGPVPSALVDEIRAAMTELDGDLPVRQLQPAEATILGATNEFAVGRDTLAFFAVLGLALASLGIYGVVARTTAQRAGEFAVRLALGARAADITRIVLATGVQQALIGSALGLLGALGVSRLIAAGFPGLRTHSPGVLLGTTLLLVAIALLACWLPARRSGKIDALHALRAE